MRLSGVRLRFLLSCFAVIMFACVPEHGPTGPARGGFAVSGSGETPAVLIAAGNLGDCDDNRDNLTANLAATIPGTVFTLGDDAFEDGTAANYQDCYAPSWGQLKSRTWATLGNHEYNTGNANASFDYFGSRAGPYGKGYYSLDLGTWHIIVLNDAGAYSPTNSYSPWYPGSPMETWLKNDLAAHPNQCKLAMWHVPLFLSSESSGYTRNSDHKGLWDDLYAAQVDVVLNGHSHHYERMAPMRPDGTRDDAAGIREINVGTGGGDGLDVPTVIHPNSQARVSVPGVIRMSLYSDHYEWQFMAASGYSGSDAGSTPCHQPAATSPPPPPPPPPDTGEVVLAGAGNIATCGNSRDSSTAQLLARMNGYVFTAGDNAFDHGSASDYSNCYGPTWGAVLSRTLPALGNHDYDTGGAAGAFGYFGSKLGSGGYYSTTVGAWHVIVLNDNVSYAAGSAQETWLRNDLAAYPARCTLAIWHQPRFFSSNDATWHSDSAHKILWDDLAAAHADVVINGHQYDYERFAPQNASGGADTTGIREFNAGTGGYSSYLPSSRAPNSQALSNAFGVLKLKLSADHYTWKFVPISGYTFSDSGTGYCH